MWIIALWWWSHELECITSIGVVAGGLGEPCARPDTVAHSAVEWARDDSMRLVAVPTGGGYAGEPMDSRRHRRGNNRPQLSTAMDGQRVQRNHGFDGATVGSCFAWGPPLTNAQMAGHVLYARIADADDTVLDHLGVEGALTIIRQDGWIAARVPDDNTSNHTLPLGNGPFTLCEVGVYSPADWERIYAAYQHGIIAYPWCAGPRDATMAGEIGPWEL